MSVRKSLKTDSKTFRYQVVEDFGNDDIEVQKMKLWLIMLY